MCSILDVGVPRILEGRKYGSIWHTEHRSSMHKKLQICGCGMSIFEKYLCFTWRLLLGDFLGLKHFSAVFRSFCIVYKAVAVTYFFPDFKCQCNTKISNSMIFILFYSVILIRCYHIVSFFFIFYYKVLKRRKNAKDVERVFLLAFSGKAP